MPLSHLNQTQVNSLTPKERIVLEKILECKTNKTIAQELAVSPETIKSHVKNILHKYNANSRVHLLSKMVEDMKARS